MTPTKRVFLSGTSIYLRALESDDLTDAYLQWLNDAEVCAGNGHAIFPNSRKKMQDYFDSTHDSATQVVMAIIAKNNDRHIGNVSLQEIDWISRSASFAIIIGDKKFWGKGAGTEAGHLVIDLAFTRLNLQRVQCGTLSSNAAMQKLASSLGMKREGVRRNALYKSGRYVDVIEYGLLREEHTGRLQGRPRTKGKKNV